MMKKGFKRSEIEQDRREALSKDRWGNAELSCFSARGRKWVIKDFSGRSRLVSATWGRWMVSREYRALARLQGIDGIPQRPFVLDARALGYLYMEGITLRSLRTDEIPRDFFPELEFLVGRMHERNIVHLDMRNRRNILLRSDGRPGLLDFQSSINMSRMPSALGRMLKQIDLSGVYKMWYKLRPDLMDTCRLTRLRAMERRRFLWVFRGYPLEHMKKRRS